MFLHILQEIRSICKTRNHSNPSEYLWKKTKQRATHNKYFKGFAALTISVESLAYFRHASRRGVRSVWALL